MLLFIYCLWAGAVLSGCMAWSYVNVLTPRWSQLGTWYLCVFLTAGILGAGYPWLGHAPVALSLLLGSSLLGLLLFFHEPPVVKLKCFALNALLFLFSLLVLKLLLVLTDIRIFPPYMGQNTIVDFNGVVIWLIEVCLLLILEDISWVIRWHRDPSLPKKRKSSVMLFVLFEVLANLLFLTQLRGTADVARFAAASLVITDISSVVVFFLFRRIFQQQIVLRAKTRELARSTELQRHYLSDMADYVSIIDELGGELRASFDELRTLSIQKDWEGLERRLQTDPALHNPTEAILFSTNAALNSLLVQKKREAQKMGVSLRVSTPITYEEKDEGEVCSVIGNLLDNALEANLSVPLESRYIDLLYSQAQGIMVIRCMNPFNDSPEHVRLAQNKVERGLGLRIVDAIAHRHHGHLHTTQNNGVFTALVILQGGAERPFEEGSA